MPGALTFHDDQRRVGPIDGKVPWGDAVFVDEVVDGGSVTPAEMVATMSPWMLMTCQVRTPASVRVAAHLQVRREPAALQAAPSSDPEASRFSDALFYSHTSSHVLWIESAKKES